jgi:bifunctional DNA-binding transcriptional regulator/antitoxin component of YhaV-PrlF toxin-antitoxin module
MDAELISTRGRFVLPVAVRRVLGLKPGMRVQAKVGGKRALVRDDAVRQAAARVAKGWGFADAMTVDAEYPGVGPAARRLDASGSSTETATRVRHARYEMTTGNKLWRAAPLAAILLNASPVWASPTSDEYRPCHRLAAEVLQRCLDERPGYENAPCWDKAKTAQVSCYADVRANHRPDPKRRAAEEAARQKR